jgi:hypothetical protein|tara:strand:+ start:13854 stop:14249 length:396 start_codon:yes stop_codon:yes gene_type:complete
MEEEIDLFEHHETLPKQVQDILESWDEMANSKYLESDRIIDEISKYGYTADYGLCGELHSLQKVSPCDIGDWAVIPDWVAKDEGVSSNYGMVMQFSEEVVANSTDINWYVHMTLKNGESVTVNAQEITKLY